MLTGPFYTPPQEEIDSLVIMLHGYGSNGDDLISLAPMLSENLPNTGFFSPDAPEPTAMGMGFQWFGDNNFTFINREGIESAKEALQAYIDQLTEAYNVPAERVVLLGFSQGTMTSLFTAPRLKQRIAGVIAYSGKMMWHEELKEAGFHKMPIMLAHGKDDDVVPYEQSVQAEKALKELGFETELHLHENLGHGINEQGIAQAKSFLQKLIGQP